MSNDAAATAQAAADFMAQSIRHTLAHKAECLIALPGGNTPVACLQRLAEMDLPWSQCHWFLGDERCYPPG
ncbi:MAG: 6-phosphogluconolactonase, partial [Gammaproteobacteria bacterium]